MPFPLVLNKRENKKGGIAMTENPISSCKKIAAKFLELVIAGRIEEAYTNFVSMEGKHHNPYFPAGFAALKKAMIQNHAELPDKQMIIRHVLGEGNLAAVHSCIIPKPGEPGMVAVHIFRFQKDKIIEMWDSVLPIPADSPNNDGAF
jgi:predicted SnoaL-like aldol condensation-catalyzing enzyme